MIKLLQRDAVLKYLPLFLQLCRFGVVGLCAAGVHFSVVILMVQTWSLTPLVANVYGFLSGFQVSYWGHRKWTFSEAVVLHQVALPKLLLVQTLAFLGNESLFYVFLSLHFPYPLALFMVLLIMPIFTFICSKLWVFR